MKITRRTVDVLPFVESVNVNEGSLLAYRDKEQRLGLVYVDGLS